MRLFIHAHMGALGVRSHSHQLPRPTPQCRIHCSFSTVCMFLAPTYFPHLQYTPYNILLLYRSLIWDIPLGCPFEIFDLDVLFCFDVSFIRGSRYAHSFAPSRLLIFVVVWWVPDIINFFSFLSPMCVLQLRIFFFLFRLQLRFFWFVARLCVIRVLCVQRGLGFTPTIPT